MTALDNTALERRARRGETTHDELVRSLEHARRALGDGDVAELRLEGRLIRPLLAASVRSLGIDRWSVADLPFWTAALSIQFVHEASLVHDDVVDRASTRRGAPSWSARHGTASALLYGDRLLTAGLRAAVATGSVDFARILSRATDRTVAGERAQRRSSGRPLDLAEYRSIVSAKTGELLGAALATVPALAGDTDRAEELADLGRDLGLVYQMADDLLDCCPRTDRGKPTLGDLRERRWTWVLSELHGFEFGEPPELIARRLATRQAGPAPLERAARRWRAELDAWRQRCAAVLGVLAPLEVLLGEWQTTVDLAISRECGNRHASRRAEVIRNLAARTADSGIERHSRSFSLAARFAPEPERGRIRDVYAWCRATDDLVDSLPAAQAGPLLDEWAELTVTAYAGTSSGVRVIDRAIRTAAEAGVPVEYPLELIEGMRMDLRGDRYETPDRLAIYTRRVAGVVGLWLTELFTGRDPWMLERAGALGHAMQLTNIVRDVGEDLARDRVYLPASLLERHDVDPGELRRAAVSGEALPRDWVSLVEQLMRQADASYEHAWEAIPALPDFFARPVAIAAEVYRGIHGAVRRNRYDVFTMRAYTGRLEKTAAIRRALVRLRRERGRLDRHPAAFAHGGEARP